MPVAADFLQPILEAPDDDTPRLIFADWLEEWGDPRGSFIRVQCELARFTVAELNAAQMWLARPGDVRRFAVEIRDLRRRERELHPQGSRDDVALARLLMPNLQFGAAPPCRWEYRRGFVAALTLTAADFLQHADALLWGPKQTMACPVLYGEGGWHKVGCENCQGTGRTLRPMPETAQPIEEVTLTTRLPIQHEWSPRNRCTTWWIQGRRPGFTMSDRDLHFRNVSPLQIASEISERLLREEWPSVKTWNLPPG